MNTAAPDPSAAIAQLRTHQKQLDADGVMVGVSRQALDEVLDAIEALSAPAAAVGGLDSRLMNLKGFFAYNSPEWNTIHEAAHALATPAAPVGGFVEGPREWFITGYVNSAAAHAHSAFTSAQILHLAKKAADATHAPAAQPSAKDGVSGEPLTDSYIQEVPDKCDRIIWRGQYHHLPIAKATTATGLVDCEVCRIFGDSNLLRKSATPINSVDDEMVVRALEALAPEAVTNRYGYSKGYRVRDILAEEDYEATLVMRAALEAAIGREVGK